MPTVFQAVFYSIVCGVSIGATVALADTPQQILDNYTLQAKQESPDFQGFDSERGKLFFQSTHGNDWSCATCHTQNPMSEGKHAKTSKMIKPLAPAANAERFTDPEKVEKWFKRNCNDVLERACNTVEKGDVLTYLLQMK